MDVCVDQNLPTTFSGTQKCMLFFSKKTQIRVMNILFCPPLLNYKTWYCLNWSLKQNQGGHFPLEQTLLEKFFMEILLTKQIVCGNFPKKLI